MRKTRRKDGFSDFITRFLKHYEGKNDQVIQINQLSNESGVEKRRLYDLMNVLVACGVCVKSSAHSYQWKGLGSLFGLLEKISVDIEVRALNEDLDQLFVIRDSPAIGTLVVNFLGIFIYFGISSLNIRDIALIMTTDEEKSKPILRRLYLVAFLLERIGILKHAQKVGECMINTDLKALQKKTFMELSKERAFPPDCIEYQLNRFDDLYISRLKTERKSQFIYQIQLRIRNAQNNNNEEDLNSNNKIFSYYVLNAN